MSNLDKLNNLLSISKEVLKFHKITEIKDYQALTHENIDQMINQISVNLKYVLDGLKEKPIMQQAPNRNSVQSIGNVSLDSIRFVKKYEVKPGQENVGNGNIVAAGDEIITHEIKSFTVLVENKDVAADVVPPSQRKVDRFAEGPVHIEDLTEDDSAQDPLVANEQPKPKVITFKTTAVNITNKNIDTLDYTHFRKL